MAECLEDKCSKVNRMIRVASDQLEIFKSQADSIPQYSIPEYSDLKDREIFLSAYSKVVNEIEVVAILIQKSQQELINLRELRSVVPQLDYAISFKQAQQNKLENLVHYYTDFVISMKVRKDSFDSMARFYNSTQYVMGGLIA